MDLGSLVDRRAVRAILVGSALAGLLGATAWAVASVSGWLVPAYFLLVVVILTAPQGKRVSPPGRGMMSEATRPGQPEPGRHAGGVEAPGTGHPVTRPGAPADPATAAVVPEDADPGTLRIDPAESAIPKPRKGRARARKTARPAVEPAPDSAPVTWVRVGPGQYVRSDTIHQGDTPAEAPPPAEVPGPAEAPPPAEAPSLVEAPAPAEDRPPVEAPASAEVPVPAEAPPPAEAPSLVEAPAPAEEPPAVEAPAPAEEPPAAQTPVWTQAPAPAEAMPPAEVPPPVEAPAPAEATPPVEEPSSPEAPTPAEAVPPAEVPAVATPGDPFADQPEPATVEPEALIEANPAADVPEADAPASEEPATIAQPAMDAPVVPDLPTLASEATVVEPTADAPETGPTAPEVIPSDEPAAEEYGIAPSAFGPAESPESLTSDSPHADVLVPIESVAPAPEPAGIADPVAHATGHDPSAARPSGRRRGTQAFPRLIPRSLVNRSPGREARPAPSRRAVRGPGRPRVVRRDSSPRDSRRAGVARRAFGRPEQLRHAWRARSPPSSS